MKTPRTAAKSSGKETKTGEYQSGQMGQTVNLLVYTFGGSNPSSPTIQAPKSPERNIVTEVRSLFRDEFKADKR